MNDLELELELVLDPGLESTLVGLGWRTYEEAFGDRAELARATARRIGEHENRAHTRGSLLSPRLVDLIRRELVHDARPPLVAGELRPVSENAALDRLVRHVRERGMLGEVSLAIEGLLGHPRAAERSFVGKPVLDGPGGQQIGKVVAEELAGNGTTLTIRFDAR